MALVAGIDSSTQSCKVVIRDADTGALVRTSSPLPSPSKASSAQSGRTYVDASA